MDRYFKILDLKTGASLAEVKRAYRSHAKFWHPDRFPSVSRRLQNKAHEKLKEINDAYQRLKRFLESRPAADASGKSVAKPPPTESEKAADRKADKQKKRVPAPQGRDRPSAKKVDAVEEPSAPIASDENGTLSWPNGDVYVGETSNGAMHGMGTYWYAAGGRYVGEFLKGIPHGRGTFFYAGGDVYVGEFHNDSIQGHGAYTYVNGDKYTGEFKNGNPHGRGIYTLANGSTHSGTWEEGTFLG